MQGYQRNIYLGIIIIALGITLSTTMAESVGAIGTVMIAVGSLFLLTGMARKSKQDSQA